MPFYAANATAAALKRQWERPLLPKRVHSDRWRLLFLAGLEGTGHHLWVSLLQACGKTGPCAADHNLSKQLWSRATTSGLWSFETKLYGAKHGRKFWEYKPPDEQWLSGFQQAEGEVRQSLRRIGQSGTSGLLVANDLVSEEVRNKEWGLGMMSYPNFGGPLKLFRTPDVRLLAGLAEDEGVDLRVLVLHRPAAALLHSTVGRGFSTWDPQAVVLEHNAQALLAQLQSLDPAFFLCTDYDRLPELPEGLEAFLGIPGLRRRLAEPLERFVLREKMAAMFHTKRGHSVNLSSQQRVGEQFVQAAVDEIYRVARCGTARS